MKVVFFAGFLWLVRDRTYSDYDGSSGKLPGSMFVSNLALFGGPLDQFGELVQRGGTEGI